MLMFVVIMSTGVLVVPSITIERAEQSAWFAALLSLPVALISLGLANALGKRFPRKTLAQYCETLLGKYLGKLAAFGFLMFLFAVSIIVTREFSDYINIMLMPETPIILLNVILLVIAIYAAVKGLEVIARIAQFILPLFLGSIIIIASLALFDAKLGELLPFMEHGLVPVISGATLPATLIGQIIIVTMLFPMIRTPQKVAKAGIVALVCSGIFLTLLTVISIATFGPKLPGDLLFPFVTLARYIKFVTVQRLEFLVVFIWVSGIVVKVSIFLYLESVAIMQIFALKNKAIIFGLLFMVHTVLATLPFSNPQETNLVLTKFWPLISFVFELVVPAGLLFIALLKGQKVVLRK